MKKTKPLPPEVLPEPREVALPAGREFRLSPVIFPPAIRHQPPSIMKLLMV